MLDFVEGGLVLLDVLFGKGSYGRGCMYLIKVKRFLEDANTVERGEDGEIIEGIFGNSERFIEISIFET